MQVTSVDDDMLDLMVWRAVGRTAGSLEAVLDVNPAVAGLPPVLPAGITITIPPEAAQRPAPAVFKLWE